MHMIAKRRRGVDDFNNISPKIPRMRGSEPHPPNPLDRRHRRQQLSKRLISRRIAIRVHVLPEQLNLRIPEIHQLPSFIKNGGGSARALLPRV